MVGPSTQTLPATTGAADKVMLAGQGLTEVVRMLDDESVTAVPANFRAPNLQVAVVTICAYAEELQHRPRCMAFQPLPTLAISWPYLGRLVSQFAFHPTRWIYQFGEFFYCFWMVSSTHRGTLGDHLLTQLWRILCLDFPPVLLLIRQS